MNNPDHIGESLERIFRVKILKFFDADPGPWIRDGNHSDPGSEINIPDPQHYGELPYSERSAPQARIRDFVQRNV
jgi:hypothetical protein